MIDWHNVHVEPNNVDLFAVTISVVCINELPCDVVKDEGFEYFAEFHLTASSGGHKFFLNRVKKLDPLFQVKYERALTVVTLRRIR